MLQEISEFNLSEMMDGFTIPKMAKAKTGYVTEYAKEQYKEYKRKHAREIYNAKRKRQRELKRLRTPMNYNDYHDPMLQQPAEKFKNPYDYGSQPMTKHNEPQDKTNAAVEASMIFEGEVDLFDKKLFPAQNRKSYSEKSGREFLADFTKATRGQLVVSMSRLAQDNPREFAKLWIEMEKFNTPQQQAVDLNANIQAKAALYDQLDKLSEPEEMSVPDELEYSPFEEQEPVPSEGDGIDIAEDYPPTHTEEEFTNQ